MGNVYIRDVLKNSVITKNEAPNPNSIYMHGTSCGKSNFLYESLTNPELSHEEIMNHRIIFNCLPYQYHLHRERSAVRSEQAKVYAGRQRLSIPCDPVFTLNQRFI